VIGIDTNILVRLALNDQSNQRKQATRYIANNCSVTSPGYINLIVLVEAIWVLKRQPDFPKAQILYWLHSIIDSDTFRVEHEPLVRSALSQYENQKIDFADALIAELNAAQGCEKTVSFDKAAVKSGIMSAL
jgi:predicted nucleic-acid-binding protein